MAAMLVAAFLVLAECYPDPPRYPVVQIKPKICLPHTFDFGKVQIASNSKQNKQITHEQKHISTSHLPLGSIMLLYVNKDIILTSEIMAVWVLLTSILLYDLVTTAEVKMVC